MGRRTARRRPAIAHVGRRGPPDAIDVAVKDGWVTLKGQVKYEFQSDGAFEDVARIKGVGGVTNEIKVVTAT